MIVNLTIIFCIIMFIVGYCAEPRKINPLTIFYGEWAIIVFLAKLNLYSIQEAETGTYNLIFVGCIMYAVGFYSVKILNISRYTSNNRINLQISKHKDYYLNKKIIYTLAIVTFIFFFIDFLQAVVYLLHGQSLNFLRQRAQEGELYNSNSVLNAIRILVAAPFSLALTPIVAANFFQKKRNKILIAITIGILLERLLSDGGRSPFIYLIMSFLICYSYFNSKGTRIKKKKLISNWEIKKPKNIGYISLFLIVCAVTLYYITLSRSGADSLRFTYYYFAMEPVMLEKWSQIVDTSGLTGFGMASVNGYLFSLFYILVNVFKLSGYPTYWRSIYDMIESVGTNWQVITSTGLTANSYASIFWTFYLDGRLIGVILGMTFYGGLVAYFYKKVIKEPNQRNLSIYCLILIGVFYTFQQLIFENIYYCIAFFILVTFAYKKKSRSK